MLSQHTGILQWFCPKNIHEVTEQKSLWINYGTRNVLKMLKTCIIFHHHAVSTCDLVTTHLFAVQETSKFKPNCIPTLSGHTFMNNKCKKEQAPHQLHFGNRLLSTSNTKSKGTKKGHRKKRALYWRSINIGKVQKSMDQKLLFSSSFFFFFLMQLRIKSLTMTRY